MPDTNKALRSAAARLFRPQLRVNAMRHCIEAPRRHPRTWFVLFAALAPCRFGGASSLTALNALFTPCAITNFLSCVTVVSLWSLMRMVLIAIQQCIADCVGADIDCGQDETLRQNIVLLDEPIDYRFIMFHVASQEEGDVPARHWRPAVTRPLLLQKPLKQCMGQYLDRKIEATPTSCGTAQALVVDHCPGALSNETVHFASHPEIAAL